MKVKVLVTQSCPTLCDPMGYSLPGSSVHGILQAIILEWVAIPFSTGSSWPRNRTQFCTVSNSLPSGKGKPMIVIYVWPWGFPDSSVDKESACNAGDPSSIPGSRRSAGEGIGYPLQYSWASLVAQLVNNLPAMRKTWVQSLGWEDPLEKGKATHSSILAWRIPWTV